MTEACRFARRLVDLAKKAGELTPGPCAVCGTTQRIHGHHEDYNQPLTLTWLCYRHHTARHLERKRIGLDSPRAKVARPVYVTPISPWVRIDEATIAAALKVGIPVYRVNSHCVCARADLARLISEAA